MSKLEKMLFETVIVVSLGLIGFMLLSVYNMRVIDKQSKLIEQLYQDSQCNHGTRGRA